MNPANGESSKRNPIHVSTELCLGLCSSQRTKNITAQHDLKPKKRLTKRWREEDAQPQEVAKQLKEKEKQLITKILSENEMLRKRVSELEKKVDELMEHGYEEEGESSACVDLTRLQPLTLECTVCWRRRAAVMLYPCHHLCVCRVCDLYIRTCPVCNVFKETSFDIKLPNMPCLN